MWTRWLKGAGSSPLRFMAVVAVWGMGTLTLAATLASPLPVIVLTVALLALAWVYTSFVLPTETALLAVRPGDDASPDDDAAAMLAEHFIAKEFDAARRGRDVTLVMFGFSHFDEFTRREGQAAAGQALREMGRLLNRLTRRMNLTARYGWRADSYLSVLSDGTPEGAEVFVRRVREAAAASGVAMPEIEVGIAVFQPHLRTPEEFVQAAQHALDAARSATACESGPPPAIARSRFRDEAVSRQVDSRKAAS